MHANLLRDWRWDYEYTKPGCELSQAYWDVRLGHLQMTKLENEMELGILQQERAEFIRRAKDNDKPGKRHMLPFYWRKEVDHLGVERSFQIPIKAGTSRYEMILDKINAKISAVRRVA